jgi:protocatechuate 3,4-dioxygenase beta subunit
MTDHDQAPVPLLTGRRRFLVLGGASVLGLAVAGCRDGGGASGDPAAAGSTTDRSGSDRSTATGVPDPAPLRALSPADFDAVGTCALLPELMAGPFPLDEQFIRRDVTEGYEGHPLRLGLRVLDEACAPLPGAGVEIWHADATGDYSAFDDGGGGKDEGAGTTFLRGTQIADDDGIVEFLSIFPGWYPGRAVHIHLRVHEPSTSPDTVGDAVLLTSQLFFDEEHIATVYADDPYARYGPPDTSNAEDAIAGDPARDGTLVTTVAAPTDRGPGTLALVNLGVDPSVRSGPGAAGGGGP